MSISNRERFSLLSFCALIFLSETCLIGYVLFLRFELMKVKDDQNKIVHMLESSQLRRTKRHSQFDIHFGEDDDFFGLTREIFGENSDFDCNRVQECLPDLIEIIGEPSHESRNCRCTKGEKGDAGERGPRGLQGSVGPSGPIGQKGDRGEKGINVVKKEEGTPRCIICPKGEKGDIGQKGNQGSVGMIGDKGSDGLPGYNGTKGERGSPGEKGLQGVKGLNGSKGDKGIPGSPGLKGEPGRVFGELIPEAV